MKSLIFCTSYFETEEHYESRVLRWKNYYDDLGFTKDKTLVAIDDNSPDTSFVGDGFNLINSENLPDKLEKANFITFPTHLGRLSHLEYLGWWRSFLFSFEIAKKYEFDKIIHIESDCYLLTDKMINIIEGFDKGWLVFWSEKYQFPETNIQVITKEMFSEHEIIEQKVEREKRKSFGFLPSFHAEHILPFTYVEKNVTGCRYGEESIPQRPEFDFYCQAGPNVPLEFNMGE